MMESKMVFGTPTHTKIGEPESVNVKVKLWTKENDAKLYDYESTNQENREQDFNVILPAVVIQEADQLKCIPYESRNEKMDEIMTIQKSEDGRVMLIPSERMQNAKLEDHIFLVVRSVQKEEEEDKGLSLDSGNIIKLGRCLIEVLEYRDNQLNVYPAQKSIHDDDRPVKSIQPKTKENEGSEREVCRICYEDDTEAFLINICKCKGGCRYVHWNCLKTWLLRTLNKKATAAMVSYSYSKFECEICKDPISRRYFIDGVMRELFQIDKPQHDPYIILKCFESKEKVTSGMINVVRMQDNDVRRVGRGNQCDLQIIEITVSREHAMLKYQDNKFWLLDRKSKFGTLKLVNEPLVLNGDHVEVQIGRSLLNLTIQNKVWNPQAVYDTQCDDRLREETVQEKPGEMAEGYRMQSWLEIESHPPASPADLFLEAVEQEASPHEGYIDEPGSEAFFQWNSDHLEYDP